jgi:ankyrin repeat protein
MRSHLPYDSGLKEYRAQVEQLLEGWGLADPDAISLFRQCHPKFLDSRIPWLPKRMSDRETRAVSIDWSDSELAIARWYDFADWPRLAEWVEAVAAGDSPVYHYETAVEAVISGHAAALGKALREHPELVRARSTRVTHHDPPQHRATLLHYIAANGVEGYRQRSPKNAVEIARLLLEAGAEPDAPAGMYGSQDATTMSMLLSSCHPAEAGVQVALVDTLVDFGASVEATGSGPWASPLMTALAFGYLDAAEALVRRGARVDHLASAAGLGRLDDARRLLESARREERHRALALAAQLGHTEIVRLLLDAGEDPDRYNPDGNHSHSTPLHQAALVGHRGVVELLVERGARLDIKDTIWEGTPLGWAEHGGRAEIAAYLGRAATHRRDAT